MLFRICWISVLLALVVVAADDAAKNVQPNPNPWNPPPPAPQKYLPGVTDPNPSNPSAPTWQKPLPGVGAAYDASQQGQPGLNTSPYAPAPGANAGDHASKVGQPGQPGPNPPNPSTPPPGANAADDPSKEGQPGANPSNPQGTPPQKYPPGSTAPGDASNQGQPESTPSSATMPTLEKYSPIELEQLCALSTNYCIYVDQIQPGTVHASPVNATDDQGGFLFEIAAYKEHPFHVCFGGCCIDIDFSYSPGCVRLEYVNRQSEARGHLLARFADNVHNIIGPRDWMFKEQVACSKEGQSGLPYAVIGARIGGKKKNKGSRKEDEDPMYWPRGGDDDHDDADTEQGGQGEESGKQVGKSDSSSPNEGKSKFAKDLPKPPPHDYFDDPSANIPDR